MYEPRRPDVAVFIDFENVYVSVRDKLNANPNFEAIMDRCGDLGRVVIARAYADWYRYPRVTSALYANAIEPIYVATYYYDKDMGRTGRAIKNSVDMNLCIDAMKTLFTHTNISKYVLVTGDRDFIPLVNSIRQQGKEVYVIGIGGAASTHLAQSADEFVFYEQLVGRTPGGSAAATAIANRATELTRNLEPVEDEEEPAAPPARRERPERQQPPTVPPVPSTPQPAPAGTGEPDVYDVLVEAIHLVRKRGYVSTLGSIKLVMKELMGGEFKESRYRDLNGRSFAKFKDFVMDAEKRGKVQIFTNGTVNEVFLPGEDPYKLSQFAAALSEETPVVEPVVDTTVLANGRKEPTPRAGAGASANGSGELAAPTGRRRRRRSRRGQGAQAEGADQNGEAELEELEYTPPVDELEEPAGDELEALAALEEPAELADLAGDSSPDELEFADAAAYAAPAVPLPPRAVVDVAPISPEELAEELTAPEVTEVLAAPEPEPAEAPSEPEVITIAPEPVEAAAAAPSEEAEEGEEAVEEAIDFSDEEWRLFREMMGGFTKPVAFQQIFDTLRGVRKDNNIARTNEQLRTMVKQAINSGLLERSGRGKRVYYALKSEE
jgi:uncharacterized protein (TIGR00288 family)